MGIIRAIGGAVGGTFADQWKDIITADVFDEHIVVSPGILRGINHGRGSNTRGSEGVITSGSKIFVPENTAAFIFSNSGTENIITSPGGYEYQNGQDSVFNGNGVEQSIFKQTFDRIGYGGISSDYKQIAFVNLREIRDIKFGTRGPLMYNDSFYGTDLEIYSYGSFTVKVIDPALFIRNFVPANVTYYTFDDSQVRSQILAEFLQSFTVALNSLSRAIRISELPAHANDITNNVINDQANAGTWADRFGFRIVKIGVEDIEFAPESRALVQQFSSRKMNLKAYEDISQHAADIAAQQQIAQGVQEHGLGDAGGMMFATNLVQTLNPLDASAESTKDIPDNQRIQSLDEQLDILKKLKELLDGGILTQDEFDMKKKQILGL